MEHSNFSLKVKSLEPDGTFTGMGAAFGNIDLGGDVIQPGAFTRTLQAAKQFPLLWQHNPDCPIGTIKATETSQGLQVEGQLLMELPEAKKAYLLIKAKVIKGLSIGFDTLQESFENGVRQLKELRLWEVSVVTFPMNESAMVTSVKSLTGAERSKRLKSVNEHRKAIDRHQRAMRMDLKALFGDDFDDDSDENPADDPALLEGNEDDSDDDDPSLEGMSYFLQELKSLTTQAEEFAK